MAAAANNAFGSTEIGAPGTLTFNTATLYASGNINNGGTISADNGTIVFSGKSAQQSSGVYTVLNMRVDNNTATVTANSAPSNKINIKGTLSFGAVSNATLNAGTGGIVILSNVTATARIADQTNGGVNSNNVINGSVTVERFISDLTTRRWHLLTAPVTGQTVYNSWQEGGNTGVAYTNYGTYITNGISATNGYDVLPSDVTNPSSSLRAVASNGTLVTPASTNATNLESYAAWFLFVRSGRPSATYTTALSGQTVLRSTGAIRQNTVFNDAVAAGTGCSPARNPFASPVNLLTATIPGNKIYVWDPGYGGSLGGYRLYDKAYTGTSYTTLSSGGAYPSTMNQLQSGQAFYVPQSGVAGNTAFKETDKTTTTNNILREQSTTVNGSIVIRLKSIDAANELTERDVTAAIFDDAYNNDLAYGEDVQKPGNFNENLSLFRGGQWISIEKRKQPVANDTLSVQLWKTTATPYKFEIEANELDGDTHAFLIDSYLGTQTALNAAGVSTYNFVSNGANADLNRFQIVFRAMGTLPVSITNIKAYKHNSGVNVEWNVSNETAIAGYDVEKSTDGNTFSKFATVTATNAATTHSYLGFDASPVSGANYYRVKSIGLNGAAKYTGVVKVIIGKDVASSVSVYPNPIKGNVVNVSLNELAKGAYTLTVYGNDGKQVAVKNVIISNTGTTNETIGLPSGTAKGIYQLKVTGNNQNIATQQLFVQ